MREEGEEEPQSREFGDQPGGELRPAQVRARHTLLWAAKTLVGFRDLGKQVLRLAVSCEVSKFARVLRSFLPGLIGRGPCRRLDDQAVLEGLPGFLCRSHFLLAT